MKLDRRRVLAGVAGAPFAFALPPGEARAGTPQSLAGFIAADGRSITATRIFVGADGKLASESQSIAGETLPVVKLQQFLMRKASRAAIYDAPPDHRIAARPDGSKDPALLFLVRGSTRVATGGGTLEVTPGMLVLFDQGADAAHAEIAGPEGYRAIKVRLEA